MSTITVGLSANGAIQYLPGSDAPWPANAKTTYTWQAANATTNAQPMFVASTICAVGYNANRVKFNIPAGQYVDHFDATVDNLGSSQPVDRAYVNFSLANLADHNGFVVNGSSTIRDKGTSIWVWDLVIAVTGVLAGVLIGFLAATSGASGPIITSAVAFAAGVLAGYAVSSRMQSF